ncbi:PLP-dependent transferase [Heliocybe sulcata]|uniref:PLP-dependent transferase n=1 Tax=Heliocybe sulcata TaxID=5364 RepID=A0A5C3N3D3_9AGAM|nr:PLP-dependent transferase [Heliocybe sulcata]
MAIDAPQPDEAGMVLLNTDLTDVGKVPTHSDGVPAVELSDSTKTNKRQGGKHLPAEFYSHHLSDAAKDRQPSAILSLFPLENTPGVISLLAGKPNGDTFPFNWFQYSVRTPGNPDQETVIKIDDDALREGLQYGRSAGQQSLIDLLVGLQEYSHGRRVGEGWRLSVGNGSQDLINKAILAMVNPGDPVLLESPVYSGVIPMFQSLNCEMIEVASDPEGISSESLRSVLESWPAGKRKPKVLYTVPTGCNPTGATTSLRRRKEVLASARDHDFLILEDDPYYYLYYGSAPRPPSYFALEADEPEVGRVLRFDSLSKVVSAGLRIGFISAPEVFVTAIDSHTATSNLHPSSLTQMVVYTLLRTWGYERFMLHCKGVSDFYREKRDVFERALRMHLDGLAEWTPPDAGMFYWFKLSLHTPGSAEADEDSEAVIRTKALEKGVLALPGTVFLPNGKKTAYVRAAFSLLSDQAIDEALRRLKEVVIEARGLSGEKARLP